jgi:hypothetical protein
MKIMTIMLAGAVAALLSVADASAQQKKKDPFCAPNGMDVCMKACTTRGGQARMCPQWCNTQLRERCR